MRLPLHALGVLAGLVVWDMPALGDTPWTWFDSSKLLATAGVSPIEGGRGGRSTNWALITGYGTRDSLGANLHYMFLSLSDYSAQLKDQFRTIADGPCAYTGHSMAAAHKGPRLTNANFNALVEDLRDAMQECAISFPVQNRLLARLAPMQHQVVTR